MSTFKDPYEKVEPPQPMRRCACCGSPGELWKYRETTEACLVYIPGCSKLEGFSVLGTQPCPLYELRHLERETKREAVSAWNEFNDELERHRCAT